jgi:hypothetical protein
MQSKRFVFLVTVVFTSMFAGAAFANRVIRPDLSIPNDPSEIGGEKSQGKGAATTERTSTSTKQQ